MSEYITAQLFYYRSILRPPEKNLRCTAKKTARGHCAQSRSRSDAPKSTDSPDLSTFAYRPNKTAAFLPDLGKMTNKAAGPDMKTFGHEPERSTGDCPVQSTSALKAVGTADSPPDLSTFAYTLTTTASRPDQSKFSNTAIRTADSPDLSTFAYKPMKPVSRLVASGRTSLGRFT